MITFYVGIALFLLSGFVGTLCSNRFKVVVFSIINFVAATFCAIPAINVMISGQSVSSGFELNQAFGTVNFLIDPLSAFFLIVISCISLISLVYSKDYIRPYIDKGKNINAHLVFLSMLIASMLLVVTCQNAVMFLIFWEIMSLSSFFLVIFENEKTDILKAGIKYLVFMHISFLFILIAFAVAAIYSGSYDFSNFANILNGNTNLANVVFIFAFIGFATKAGFIPFHNWLPDTHPAAPSHVSAIMSGVMIKTGIYGILRVLSLIAIPSKMISYVVLIIALLSALYGVLYAITQNDIKRLLSYCSIENIGIIGIGIGVGMLGLAYANPIVALLGFAGGILHILNHSIFKELLFLAAGSVYLKTHTRNIELLGGLIKPMPATAMLFLVGSIAICGLPPFNGFVSEFLIYLGILNGLSINNFFSVLTLLFVFAGLALVGTMAILCFTKVFSITFQGMPRSEHSSNVSSDVSKTMIIPLVILVVLMLLIGLFPQHAFNFVLKPVGVFVTFESPKFTEILTLMQTLAVYSLSFLIFVIVMCGIKLGFCRNKIVKEETWGCGYNKSDNHVQYTASSYASPYLSMLKPLFKKVFDIEKPQKLFPKKAHFRLHIDDIEEAYFINPLIKLDEWFLSKFETIQDGNIQSYIKYGLIFLALLIIGSFLVR